MESTPAGAERASARALDEPTICAAFQATAEAHGDRVAIRTKGDELTMTWREYAERVRRIASGLAALGLSRGDTIALMLTNRPEFHLVDTAAIHLGAIPFSVYNTYSAEEIDYLMSDAENRIVVTEQSFLDGVLAARDRGSGVEHLIVVDGDPPDGTLSLDEVEARGEEGFDFEAAWSAVQPDDLLTLIYTSGTTGPPKGVQITHANIMAAAQSFNEIIEFPDGARVVSYLPMAHIAERACSHYLPMLLGFTTTCCPDPRQVIAYLPEVRPDWFFSVPRIWEKAKAALEAVIEAEQDEDRKRSMSWAIDVGLRKVRAEQAGEGVPADLREEYERADSTVLSKIREQVGLHEAVSVNVGAAPTPPEVIEFFHAIGIPLGELWGMSETCGAGTCNLPGRIKIGTVGPPLPGIEIKLADDGEVLVRSPVVMKGYRNQPEKTRETIDEEGWLHTGDVGELDDEGFLKIVDRKKELIINAAGENMSPANIEAKLKIASPLIGQAVAIGDRRPYITALITLDPDAAPGFASRHGIEDPSPAALAGEQAVIAEVQRATDRANDSLSRIEQVKKFKILREEWEAGGEELTPTMKLKRGPIVAKYEEEIEGLYA